MVVNFPQKQAKRVVVRPEAFLDICGKIETYGINCNAGKYSRHFNHGKLLATGC